MKEREKTKITPPLLEKNKQNKPERRKQNKIRKKSNRNKTRKKSNEVKQYKTIN